MSMREGLRALLRWTPSGVIPSVADLRAEDFERAHAILGARFERALAQAKTAPRDDEEALWRLAAAYERMQGVGAILGAAACLDHDKFNTAWTRWGAAEHKLLIRARSSRALRSLLLALSEREMPVGKAEAISRSPFWGAEAYEPKKKGAERRALAEREARLTEKFKANARAAATRTWLRVGKESAESLSRIAAPVMSRAQSRAAALGQKGWVFAAEFSAYGPFMHHCSDRKLREKMYKARARLASEWGDKERDNTQLGLEILRLRAAQARAAGKSSYAEYCMEAKMLSTPEAAESFLLGLAGSVAERAKKERKDAFEWLREAEGARAMQPWDWRRAFFGLREERAGDAQNDSRPYFPVMPTIEKSCELVASFLGAKSARNRQAEAESGAAFIAEWTRDGAQKPFARIWIEPWASPKRALVYAMHWPMVEPRAGVCGWSLVCLREDPHFGGMKHSDVSTLLHELGHAAHAMGPVSRWGEKGAGFTEPDGIEFHSQFFERLAWDKKTLDQLSSDPAGVPDELFARLNRQRAVDAASELLSGIAESLTDLRVHGRSAAKRARLWDVFNLARQEVGLSAARGYRRFFHTSFAMTADHACGDYGYAWTSALAAQAFKAWQDERDKKGEKKAAARFNAIILREGSSSALQTLITQYCGAGPAAQAWIEEIEEAERVAERYAARAAQG